MPVQSNCVNICRLYPTLGMCEGCGRIGLEIERWSLLQSSERNAIMIQCTERLKLLDLFKGQNNEMS
jgi:predicted Fe-S protein YdhL (DUF1289 family)